MPTQVAPDRLLGTHNGHGFPLGPLFAVAFTMGTRYRLVASNVATGWEVGGRRKPRLGTGSRRWKTGQIGSWSLMWSRMII